MEDQTFHQSISKILAISQIFGLLPVSNILSQDVARIRYNWISFPTIYSGIIIVANLLEFGIFMNLLLKTGLNFHTSGTLSLFVACCLEQLYFWRLASRWPSIMQIWRRIEEIFLHPPYRLYANINMKLRMYTLTFVVLFCALVEHSGLVYNSFHKSGLELKQCNLNISFWEILFRRERVHLSFVLPYQVWMIPIAEWTNLTLAYSRSFTDAFIICVSIGLATRFRQLYLRIEAVHTKIMPTIFWTEVRNHYLNLKSLLRLLNQELAILILLACSNNMYFICFQLFNSFQNIGVDTVAVSVFWFSLIFAIARAMLTLYIAATINDFSSNILSTLRDVPSRAWCLEIQRFSEQLTVDLTAFSGNGFFLLTRKLMLAMLSTIVTYELMVTNIINKGSIQQKTDYCSAFWMDYINDEETLSELEDEYDYW